LREIQGVSVYPESILADSSPPPQILYWSRESWFTSTRIA
jgi:hypothetical protein